jgi:hypothetical protein
MSAGLGVHRLSCSGRAHVIAPSAGSLADPSVEEVWITAVKASVLTSKKWRARSAQAHAGCFRRSAVRTCPPLGGRSHEASIGVGWALGQESG